MTMRTLLSITALPFALLGAGPALAETFAETRAEAQASAGPALWKVADEDTTIYLFGTVHVLPKEIVWYTPTIAKAFEASDTLVTEIPMDPASEAQMAQLSQTMGLLPEGTTLRSLLNDEQKGQYAAALADLGPRIEAQQLAALPPEWRAAYDDAKAKGLVPQPADALAAQFDRMKPWMVGLTLSILPLTVQGYDLASGAEKVLLAKAPAKQKDALETAEFQLGIFNGMPQDAQIAFMMEAATTMDSGKSMIDRMVAEWVKGAPDQLAKVMNEGLDDPKVAEALLYNRNANWAEWIGKRLETPGTVFIAVGAGHLAGERSVQDYLAKKRIKTTRVK